MDRIKNLGSFLMSGHNVGYFVTFKACFYQKNGLSARNRRVEERRKSRTTL